MESMGTSAASARLKDLRINLQNTMILSLLGLWQFTRTMRVTNSSGRKCTITNQGMSEYRINNRIVTASQYNDALEAENILDVEAIASQSTKDLTRIEQISGSLEYKGRVSELCKPKAEEIR